MTTFLKIFRRFPTSFRRFPKIFQNFSEGKANVYEHFSDIFRRLPKISEDFRGGTDDVSIIQQYIKYFLRDYVTIAMVIILVTMATPISSHVKDKNSMFTACDEHMIF